MTPTISDFADVITSLRQEYALAIVAMQNQAHPVDRALHQLFVDAIKADLTSVEGLVKTGNSCEAWRFMMNRRVGK